MVPSLLKHPVVEIVMLLGNHHHGKYPSWNWVSISWFGVVGHGWYGSQPGETYNSR